MQNRAPAIARKREPAVVVDLCNDFECSVGSSTRQLLQGDAVEVIEVTCHSLQLVGVVLLFVAAPFVAATLEHLELSAVLVRDQMRRCVAGADVRSAGEAVGRRDVETVDVYVVFGKTPAAPAGRAAICETTATMSTPLLRLRHGDLHEECMVLVSSVVRCASFVCVVFRVWAKSASANR
jgi:hypothetical protein